MPEITVIVDGKAIPTGASTIRDVIKDKRVIAARVGGILVDLSTSLADGITIETISADCPEGVGLLRHSTAHVMAEAVKFLFPDARPTIGPSTEDGFYYDFDREEPFSSEDLAKIEEKMSELVKQDTAFIRRELPKRKRGPSLKKRVSPIRWRSLTTWATT